MRTNTAAVASPAPKKRHASQKARTAISTTIIYIILIVMSILWILPILWIVLQSFTGEQQASFGKFIPAIWDFQVVAGQANPIAPEIVYGTTLGPFGNYVQLFTNVRATDASFSQIVPSNFNFFGRIVNGLYTVDTSTNVFPSIHVYNSLVVNFALIKCKALKGHNIIKALSWILCISICLSTVFLKQHSVTDVVGGIVLYIILYIFIYVIDYSRFKKA